MSPELRRARRMVAVFWVFTVLYVLLSVALLVTRGASGLIFTAILVYSWFFQGWPDTDCTSRSCGKPGRPAALSLDNR